MRFTASGSWTNVSGVTVGGGTGDARLTLANRKAFAKATVLKLADKGCIELADGVTVKVGELSIGGKRQTDGLWGSSESGAISQDDTYFAGRGKLSVGDVGLRIVVR